MLIYLVIGRFYNDFKNTWVNYNSSYANYGNVNVSKGLLLDLCPFVAFFLPVTLIIDPTRKLATTLAYYGIFGGMITFFGEFLVNDVDPTTNPHWNAHWIFMGDSPNSMYFAMHAVMLIVSPWVLLNSKRNFIKDYSKCSVFILWYFFYVSLCATKFSVARNATGMVEGDWEIGGEYNGVTSFIKLSFPWVAVVSFLLVAVLITGYIIGYHFLQRCKKYQVEEPNLNPFKVFLKK